MKNDRDILDKLQASDKAFVCFRPDEDVFSMVTYRTPGAMQYRKVREADYLQASGLVLYNRYKDGVEDDGRLAFGKWIKFEDVAFTSDESAHTEASVNSAEVSLSYSYENLQHTKTTYSLQIRRSTLRFTENFTWAEPQQTKTKGAKQPPVPEAEHRMSYTGYCAEFPPPTHQ